MMMDREKQSFNGQFGAISGLIGLFFQPVPSIYSSALPELD